MVSAVIFTVGGACMGFAPGLEMILIGRFTVGAAIGNIRAHYSGHLCVFLWRKVLDNSSGDHNNNVGDNVGVGAGVRHCKLLVFMFYRYTG